MEIFSKMVSLHGNREESCRCRCHWPTLICAVGSHCICIFYVMSQRNIFAATSRAICVCYFVSTFSIPRKTTRVDAFPH
jgi:hypothetical protein